ncbi:glycoside hydrolase family 2 [Prevotella sp. 10(H)]|uniref:glycoside hydrolase family 2 n=1 Tax=Prevotella sp. 10(H) TaxID=1158294 RepID=UPI0004A72D0A|nr:glycoside hydrolase family 2 [Prevotella sp. 10(H)]
MKYTIIVIMLLSLFSCSKNGEAEISLAGEWQFSLDAENVGINENWYSKDFTELITLPGTTDDAGKGIPNTLEPSIGKPQILHLTRKNSYVGAAWYKKEVVIPSDWKNKTIALNLERVIWETSVWVDGKAVPVKGESLIAPQYFDLTEYLTPGKHTICLRIDNSKKYDISINDKCHAYTNETQIMWNGVIGDISLKAHDPVSIKQIDVYPNVKDKNILVKVHLNNSGKEVSGKLSASVKLKNSNKSLNEITSHNISINKQDQIVEMTYPMGDSFLLWNEITPNVYELSVSLKAGDYNSTRSTDFGMRNLKQQNASILLNDKRVFMRGTLECCIFPLTGHPPMDKPGWEKVMKTAREWGLNHLRFHSWCPPKAAFEVADELGFYLQVELPLWSLSVGKDQPTNSFLYAEADRIMNEYGNHPSFCMFSLGNELQPDFDFMTKLLSYIKGKDNRRLYTTTSFTFERGHGSWPEPDDDFFITQWTKQGWVRGQGVFNEEPPRFDKDYSEAVNNMPVPLITHEVGQYAVYPNMKEIEKYTGVLDPLNFKGVKKELEQKGLIDKADDYLMASGKLAALLYKEEIERALKTPGCSGFQLLDLHDFPGQSTALVGLIDAFWDSKGVIDPAEFRQSCTSIVPLIRYPKATYTNNESFNASVEIAHYGNDDLKNKTVFWNLKNAEGKTVLDGKINNVNVNVGQYEVVGNINCTLNSINKAEQLLVTVGIEGTDYLNSWKIWVYPADVKIEKKDIILTADYNEAQRALKEGKKVLFNPPFEKLKGLEGKFLPVFWSPVHFPKQAGTMGILCNPKHKLLENFPTDIHTDWQWWHLLTNSKTIVTDSIYTNIEPIVECVDNFANNRRLATIFETNCEKGKLLFCSIDLIRQSDSIPEIRQLLYSITNYMNSSDFNPKQTIEIEKIQSLIDKTQKEYKRASAISVY